MSPKPNVLQCVSTNDQTIQSNVVSPIRNLWASFLYSELHRFKFNHIFQKNAYQDQVFTKVAKGVIDNCLAGYNGTIFAYGQTGSGKTFTVTGKVQYSCI